MTKNIGRYVTLLLRYYCGALEQILTVVVIGTVYLLYSAFVLVFAPLISLVQLAWNRKNLKCNDTLIYLTINKILGEE
jgi:hypothetical protein